MHKRMKTVRKKIKKRIENLEKPDWEDDDDDFENADGEENSNGEILNDNQTPDADNLQNEKAEIKDNTPESDNCDDVSSKAESADEGETENKEPQGAATK